MGCEISCGRGCSLCGVSGSVGAPYAWECFGALACTKSVPAGGAFTAHAVNAPEVAWRRGLLEDGNRAAHASLWHRAYEYGEEYYAVAAPRLG